MTYGTLFALAVASYLLAMVVLLRVIILLQRVASNTYLVEKLMLTWVANWNKEPEQIKRKLEVVINHGNQKSKK